MSMIYVPIALSIVLTTWTTGLIAFKSLPRKILSGPTGFVTGLLALSVLSNEFRCCCTLSSAHLPKLTHHYR